MVNEFLISKWKIWYKSLDVNHDGKISMEDVEESRSKFSELHHLDAEKKMMVMDNFEKWWSEYIFRGRKGEISETEFVDALSNDFKKDKAKFVKHMEQCFHTLFDVIDTNKDRNISQEEFLVAFKAYGHENVALDTKFYQAYNPINDAVPLRDIVSSWVDFAVSEDSSKPNVVKNAFEAGV